jgi:hypothetical protein
MVTPAQLNEWMAGQRLPGTKFRLNDSVAIRSGVASGQTGAIISLLKLAPKPRYLVETSLGQEVEVAEDEMDTLES